MIQWFAEEIDIIRQEDCGFSFCSNKYVLVVFLRKKVVPLSSVPIDVGRCGFSFFPTAAQHVVYFTQHVDYACT